MEIRVLGRADVAAFKSIRLEALENSPESFGESLEEARGRADGDFERMLSDHGKGDFVLGGFLRGMLIGVAGFHREAAVKFSHKASLWGVYVVPDYRGRQYGASLVAKVVEMARSERDVRQINLVVVATNAPALAIYESLGFVTYGKEPQAICAAGAYHDEYHMKLFL